MQRPRDLDRRLRAQRVLGVNDYDFPSDKPVAWDIRAILQFLLRDDHEADRHGDVNLVRAARLDVDHLRGVAADPKRLGRNLVVTRIGLVAEIPGCVRYVREYLFVLRAGLLVIPGIPLASRNKDAGA